MRPPESHGELSRASRFFNSIGTAIGGLAVFALAIAAPLAFIAGKQVLQYE